MLGRALAMAGAAGLAMPSASAWLPGTGNPAAVSGFSVDTLSRMDVLAFYQCVYQASEGYEANMAWSGNVSAGIAGTTSSAFKNDVLRRINFYRALAGLPGDISFDAAKSAMCQEAALMYAANNSLSHTPPDTWTWWTANAAEAAANSNISLGSYGPDSVDGFMEDFGGGNELVGHRRWLLYSRARQMGTGDVPFGTHNAANAIWVIGNPKPAPAPQFVAWPDRGFVPDSLVPGRWSLSYPGANFSAATVTMTQNGSPATATIIARDSSGTMGDNTIVWVPAGIPTAVTSDMTYNVTVSGITGAGAPASHSYTVTLFDPDNLNDSISINGSSTPATTGQAYAFNAIEQADQYELRVRSIGGGSWLEGAEDAPVPQISENISAGHTLRQTGLKRTGAKAFQLTYPSGVFSDQSFTFTRGIVPSAGSQLQFCDRARFSVTTTTLRAEVSTDDGATWTSIFSRNGVGLNSGLWDANWIPRSVSLAAYAGQVVKLRFVMNRNGGSVTQGVTSNFGFFIDDISVTDASEVTGTTITPLASSAAGFTLNAATAGAPLSAGSRYFMDVRPNVGCRWFGYGATRDVTAQTAG